MDDPMTTRSLPTRFASKFQIVAATDCWIWTASRHPRGYGMFKHKGVNWKAHRFAYQALVGPIPEWLEIDHLCRNKACVNPEHLEAVTHCENVGRGARVGRAAACQRGHPRITDSIIDKRGDWHCRTCDKLMHDLRRHALSREKVATGVG